MSRSLITKREITEQDLLDLVTNQQAETDWIDYKENSYPWDKIPSDKHKVIEGKKQDLCNDVSAIANAQGGILVLGMAENGDSTPRELVGLEDTLNIDQDIRRLKSVVDSGVRPRIPGLEFRAVGPLSNGKWAIVIQVPRSPLAPHASQVGKEAPLFYIRRSNGNAPMTYEELRMAFTQVDQLVHRVKEFRKERIAALTNPAANPDVPVNLADGLQLILHIVPLWASSVDLRSIKEPEYANGFLSKRFNIDGVCISYFREINVAKDYYQFFRNGAVEYVRVFQSNADRPSIESLSDLERWYIIATNYILHQLAEFQTTFPLIVMITLNNTIGWEFERIIYYRLVRSASPRNLIAIPDLLVEEYPAPTEDRDQACARLLRDSFDTLWNVFGETPSHTFDKAGKWSPPR